jgi:integrase/recombinase XerC
VKHSWARQAGLHLYRDPAGEINLLASRYAGGTADLLAAHTVHMERRGNTRSSIDTRLMQLRATARYLAPSSLLDATRKDIETFLDTRRNAEGKPIVNKTRYIWLSHLHAFYRWAINEELTDRDPTLAIVRPKMKRNLPRPIGDDDLARALAVAPPQMRAMLACAAYQGLRCQEIAGLSREDVLDTREPPVIVVVDGKGGHQRIVPLHPETLSALRCLPMPKSGPLFTRTRGGRFTPPTMSAAISAYLEELGIKATAHQARHWFGTGIYANTHDIRLTQELMGHQSPQTTSIYVAWAAVDAAPAVASLRVGHSSSKPEMHVSVKRRQVAITASADSPEASASSSTSFDDR